MHRLGSISIHALFKKMKAVHVRIIIRVQYMHTCIHNYIRTIHVYMYMSCMCVCVCGFITIINVHLSHSSHFSHSSVVVFSS